MTEIETATQIPTLMTCPPQFDYRGAAPKTGESLSLPICADVPLSVHQMFPARGQRWCHIARIAENPELDIKAAMSESTRDQIAKH